ncbi:hypothetical protein [Isoptericola aurantiacus]|uniref:hypothetical protein n=1 Tax=Isoptericola aurantiacus TaxID=3377839 RepID=UPI00383A2D10
MSDRKPIGDTLDSLGVRTNLRDGELISGAFVLLKTVDEDGDVNVRAIWSDGLSWFDRRALIEVARDGEIDPERREQP